MPVDAPAALPRAAEMETRLSGPARSGPRGEEIGRADGSPAAESSARNVTRAEQSAINPALFKVGDV